MPATGYRYLVNLPNVRGGNVIVDGTRIGVHDVVGLIVNGSTIDDVVRSFPDLTRAQVYECLAYYEDHESRKKSLWTATTNPSDSADGIAISKKSSSFRLVPSASPRLRLRR